MAMDWQDWRIRHPRLFALALLAKKQRTKVGLALVVLFLVESVYHGEIPLDLDKPDIKVWIALTTILAGLGLRLSAYGCIRKKEVLATTGAYSLCRHPLYLGSMLMTFGFCVLINDPKAFIAAAAYFAVFYTLTIVWEEFRCAVRYGEAHREYAARTPLLLPLGRLRGGDFSWGQMASNGGAALVVVTAFLLIVVEVMAETLPRLVR